VSSEWRTGTVRPAVVKSDDPSWDRVGELEPCDWCGRPGVVEQGTIWRGATLVCRNPSLCDVCAFWYHLDSDVIDAITEVTGWDYDEVMAPFEKVFIDRWQERVREGRRRPQAPGDHSVIFQFEEVQSATADDRTLPDSDA
jgi:hypothetical protein